MEGLDIPFRYITQVADIIIFSQAFASNGLAYHQEGLKMWCSGVQYPILCADHREECYNNTWLLTNKVEEQMLLRRK